jgi:hypothetical protein
VFFNNCCIFILVKMESLTKSSLTTQNHAKADTPQFRFFHIRSGIQKTDKNRTFIRFSRIRDCGMKTVTAIPAVKDICVFACKQINWSLRNNYYYLFAAVNAKFGRQFYFTTLSASKSHYINHHETGLTEVSNFITKRWPMRNP